MELAYRERRLTDYIQSSADKQRVWGKEWISSVVLPPLQSNRPFDYVMARIYSWGPQPPRQILYAIFLENYQACKPTYRRWACNTLWSLLYHTMLFAVKPNIGFEHPLNVAFRGIYKNHVE